MSNKVNEKNDLKRADMLEVIHYRKKELEYVLGVGKTKIDEWIKRGEIVCYKIDGTLFVHRDDVESFVRRHRIGQKSYQVAEGL